MEHVYIIEHKMEYVYVVIENGEAYLQGYRTYKAAVAAVKEKHKEYLEAFCP